MRDWTGFRLLLLRGSKWLTRLGIDVTHVCDNLVSRVKLLTRDITTHNFLKEIAVCVVKQHDREA